MSGQITFYYNDGKSKWKCDNLTKEYQLMGRDMVRAARHYLDKEKKNATGNLRKSVGYEYSVDKDNNVLIGFTFDDAGYWQYVEYGVGGVIKGPENKAPDSPFQFGTRTGREGGLRGAIDRWVISKKLPGFRDAKGRFVPRKTQVQRISRKIYLYGIEPTPFASDSLDSVFTKYRNRLATAWTKDIERFLGDAFDEEITITISL
tara:strand:- start:5932 stop:6543 length:612 start_codon:yes stop_codon:yes gene_type:complete